jgi:TPP-dependent indolepyruvate ferredoxin oxidoreductase alpha subunit
MTLPYKTTDAEVVKLTCDVYNWMNAYIIVLDNPFFAITGAKDAKGKSISATDFRASQSKGSYRIENIPAGKYRVQAWHETLGLVRNQKVDIPETGESKLSFASDMFKMKGKK